MKTTLQPQLLLLLLLIIILLAKGASAAFLLSWPQKNEALPFQRSSSGSVRSRRHHFLSATTSTTTTTAVGLHLPKASKDLARAAAISEAFRGGGVQQASAVAVPTMSTMAAASVVPACLGFWKVGYTVSYGYGGAMLASGLLMILKSKVVGVAKLHALALAFYGLRLNLFLLYRELAFPVEVHQMKRRDATVAERLKRAPLILGCSGLFFCMAAPLRISAQLASSLGPAGTASATVAVALAFCGFALAAAGDAFKTYVKTKEGPDFLVTTGPFKRLRHPNYTGEMFGWTASLAAAIIAVASRLVSMRVGRGAFVKSVAPWLLASVLGWAGIMFVLAGEATAGLEKKQKEKYGGMAAYEEWVAKSWAGPMISPPAASSTPIDNDNGAA